MRAVFCAINSKFIHTCLSAHILINHTDKSITDTVLEEYSINDNEDIVLKNLYTRNADIYIFSVYIFNVEYIKKIISKLKKTNPSSIIILGGPEVSFDSKKFLINNPSADIIVLGEGEATLNNVLYALENNSDLADVENIVFKKGDEIAASGRNDEVTDMNDITFPYNDYNIGQFKNKIIYYESSRGCPYRCAYCMSANEKHVRYKSLDKVFCELTFFIKNKVPIVKFTDRTFNANTRRAQKIWQFIFDRNICTTFHFEIAADILSEENISLLKKMPPHFVQLEAGVQSIKPQTLKAVNRASDLGRLEHNISRLTKGENIHIHTDLIAGLLYEGYEDFKKSFNYEYRLNSHMIQLGFLKILKGSPMADMVQDGEYIYDEYAPYEVMGNKWISYKEIIKLKAIEMLVDRYYNSQSFTNILSYIIENYYKNNEFGFFEHLSEFFDKNNYIDMKISKSGLYEILNDFLITDNISDIKAKTLLSFDFLLNNSSTLPQSLYLEEINKVRLYELIQNNDSSIPKEYRTLSYKQLIKHMKVFSFAINPETLADKQTFIAFYDIKQNTIYNHKKYAILSN